MATIRKFYFRYAYYVLSIVFSHRKIAIIFTAYYVVLSVGEHAMSI